MLITWIGHACVVVERSDNYVIVFDPHDGESIGLKKPDIKADMVLVSHEHYDHNAVDIVRKQGTRVFREFIGEAEIDNVRVKGLETYHDKFGGKRRGLNTIYIVETEGYRLAHLGDLGHIPGEDVLKHLENTDLLMIPVGGTYTIEPDEAWSIIVSTEPSIILPIHYWIPGLRLPLRPIDEFLKYVKKYHIVRLDTNSFRLEDYENSIMIPRI